MDKSLIWKKKTSCKRVQSGGLLFKTSLLTAAKCLALKKSREMARAGYPEGSDEYNQIVFKLKTKRIASTLKCN